MCNTVQKCIAKFKVAFLHMKLLQVHKYTDLLDDVDENIVT